MIIYKITNKKNGKSYIGQTIRTLKERIKEHKKKNTSLISKAIRKYGMKSFNVCILEECFTLDNLNKREMYWIKEMNTVNPNGYNLCEGGGGTLSREVSYESKLKMSKSQIKRNMKGHKNPFYGMKHTNETRQKMKNS